MVRQVEDDSSLEGIPLPLEEIQADATLAQTVVLVKAPPKLSKPEIRSSLKALTVDGIFAAPFYNVIGGALLSNFLLDLGASPVEIGTVASMPLLTDLLQPVGAYFADRTKSRNWYSICIFVPARLLWLILVLAIGLLTSSDISPHRLVQLTLAVSWVSNTMEALGRASWISWMAALVPQRLRGRYFGLRNSTISLTNLISVPLLGLAVSKWPGGTIEGYRALLVLGVVCGLVSQSCQFWMADVNPQLVQDAASDPAQTKSKGTRFAFLKEANFLKFVLYFGLWSFAVNLSAPFFNLYMLDNLDIDVSVVTLYGSLAAGANLLMQVVWGKLADRIGNRPLLIIMGAGVAMVSIFWLVTKNDPISLWLWLPLLQLLGGGMGAALDLCNNNLLMAVAPLRNQSSYFGIAAAVFGVSGATGIISGSFLATQTSSGGLLGLFALSAVLRIAAVLPLIFVQEQRSVPLSQLWQVLSPFRRQEITS